jgi:hypothetical protein
MPELKTMKEWNPQKGDVFRHHFSNGKVGGERVFDKWSNPEAGSWLAECFDYSLANCHEGGYGSWELVRRAAPTITLDKEWAYRHTPTQPVRILCVDGNDKGKPVVSMGPEGNLSAHDSHGAFLSGGGESGFDLVPLQERVADVWIVLRNDGTPIHEVFSTADASSEWIEKWGLPHYKPYRVVRMTQAEEKS